MDSKSDHDAARALKARLPLTWNAFFGRFGSFTPAQMAAIPPVLDGANVLISAATASGKTEAALAPLAERLIERLRAERDPQPALRLVCLLPTRALVADLYQRLQTPCDALRLHLAVKTHDHTTFSASRPAHLLLTTPEGLDSLLTSHARVLAHVHALVIDELHLFDGSARGDHLRVLLNRVRRIRTYAAQTGDAPDPALQFVALSATLPDPTTAAARYFSDARIVHIPGTRALHIEAIPLDAESPAALLSYLRGFRARGWKKALIFCNTRAEVEQYAHAARQGQTPFGGAIYAHYSNIDAERRAEIETRFAADEVAVCFATSTLELGIDIGSIDAVAMIGAPGDRAAFVQRAGRGSRRRQAIQVACFYRSALDAWLFDALAKIPVSTPETRPTAFRPSVAVQQIFSLLKQSPTGGVRLAELTALFDGMLGASKLEAILGHLQYLDYLRTARPGEWRAGPKFNRLVDLQFSPQTTMSVHSNIQNAGGTVQLIDQGSGRALARVDAGWFDRDKLTLEGRPLRVAWADGEAAWVTANADAGDDPIRPPYLAARQLLNYDLARSLPEVLGLQPGDAPLIPVAGGWAWFHWLGDLYGQAFGGLLRGHLAVAETAHPGLCIALTDEPRTPPTWTPEALNAHLAQHYRRYESMLALGAYHHLLPVELRRKAVIAAFDVSRFLNAVAGLRPLRAPENLIDDLSALC